MSLVIFSGRGQISCDLLKKYFSGEIYDSTESKIVVGNGYKTTDKIISDKSGLTLPIGSLEHKSHQNAAFTLRECGLPFVIPI